MPSQGRLCLRPDHAYRNGACDLLEMLFLGGGSNISAWAVGLMVKGLRGIYERAFGNADFVWKAVGAEEVMS